MVEGLGSAPTDLGLRRFPALDPSRELVKNAVSAVCFLPSCVTVNSGSDLETASLRPLPEGVGRQERRHAPRALH